MNRKMPQVREFMTKSPITLAHDTPVQTVEVLFRERGIRHAPVKQGDKLLGVVSDRNARAALLSPRGQAFMAADIMIPDPFVVEADTPLDEVAAQMAEEKFGCAIVKDDDGKLVGIFTTVDACRALRQLLEEVFPQ